MPKRFSTGSSANSSARARRLKTSYVPPEEPPRDVEVRSVEPVKIAEGVRVTICPLTGQPPTIESCRKEHRSRMLNFEGKICVGDCQPMLDDNYLRFKHE